MEGVSTGALGICLFSEIANGAILMEALEISGSLSTLVTELFNQSNWFMLTGSRCCPCKTFILLCAQALLKASTEVAPAPKTEVLLFHLLKSLSIKSSKGDERPPCFSGLF